MLLAILTWLLEGVVVPAPAAREVRSVTGAAARDPPTNNPERTIPMRRPSGGEQILGSPGQGRESLVFGQAPRARTER
jgi:hypothetical protein